MRYLALLRAINVGKRQVKMAALREHFTAMGFEDVQTYIQTGNVLFSTTARDPAALEAHIEAQLAAALGFDVPTFTRTGAEVAALLAQNPFSPQPGQDLRVQIGVLKSAAEAERAAALPTLETDVDRLHLAGRTVYWARHMDQGSSSLDYKRIEKLLGLASTFRNTNTFTRLAALLEA